MFEKVKFQTLSSLVLTLCLAVPGFADGSRLETAPIEFAGALEFGPDGILFVGDNVGAAIYAFDVGSGEAPEQAAPIGLDNIDAAVAAALGVGQNKITINDMAVHPVTREVYLSVTRGAGTAGLPALVKVDYANKVHNLPIADLKYSVQAISDAPDASKTFKKRGFFGSPPNAKEIAKSELSVNTLTIMDMEWYKGELFVSGISNEEFASTLRRMPYPFKGEHASTKVKMFHIAHDQWETRAPIRSMIAKDLGGTDYLIAAYTCSPVVLIPISDIKDDANITGRTIGDIGNGQPVDMFTFNNKMAGGGEYVYMTNNSRQPQLFALEGLQNAEGLTEENTERGLKTDMVGAFPIGPLGRPVMFVGASLHADKLNEKFFVSLTRDTYSGSLNLESLPSLFPITLHHLTAEFDFEGVKRKSKE